MKGRKPVATTMHTVNNLNLPCKEVSSAFTIFVAMREKERDIPKVATASMLS